MVSIDTEAAATAVNEFLARLHPYRYDGNEKSAIVRMSWVQGERYRESEETQEICPVLGRYVGRGDVEPLLDLPELSEAAARP